MSDDPVPTAKTHLDELERPAERFESYHDAASPMFDSEPLVDKGMEDARCSVWRVDDLVFGRTGFTRTLFRRSPKQTREDSGLMLQLYGGGEQLGEANGRSFRIDAQHLVLQDLAHPYTAVAEADDILAVIIPRHRLGAQEWVHRQAFVTWDVNSPAGQILNGSLHTILNRLPELRQSEAAPVVGGFVGLLDGLLMAEPGAREGTLVENARLEAMKAFLLRNLHDPNLSPDSLGKDFGCSRAKVYRLFERDGGVAAFLREQRLARCFADLSSARPGSATVQQVAARRGFSDPYHFSRLFKRTFGVPPSDVLHREPSAAGTAETLRLPGDGSARVRDWVKAF